MYKILSFSYGIFSLQMEVIAEGLAMGMLMDKKIKQRVELACHTGYSSGLGLNYDWVEFAKNENIHTLVITDSGIIEGYMDFSHRLYGNHSDIKLIMGIDLCVVDEENHEGRLSVLIKNEAGRSNLYKILNEGEKTHKNIEDELHISLDTLLENRDGLLIGSGTADSLIFRRRINRNTDSKRYSFLDYVEIPAYVNDGQEIQDRLNLAKELNIPTVVVCAPHYLQPDDKDIFSILNNFPGDIPRHYHTTDELLKKYSYLGEDKAFELVVENSNYIADLCEEVPAISKENLYPIIENQDSILKEICQKALLAKYPEITEEIQKKLDWELTAIKKSESAFMFLQLKNVFEQLNIKPFEVIQRGIIGASIVAYLCDICEVDPIKENLSPYFLYGFDGDKEPYFEIGVREDIKKILPDAIKNSLGVEEVFSGWTYENTEVGTYTKVGRKWKHPAAIMMMPKGVNLEDVFPITYLRSEDCYEKVCAFNYHSIDDNVYKINVVHSITPEIIKNLYSLTHISPDTISTEDAEVMEMFKWHGDSAPNCTGVPEFDDEYILGIIKETKPETFEALVKIYGLAHGTDVWIDNAQILFKEELVVISDVIASRDDVYDTLIKAGIEEKIAYKLTEDVRKGKVWNGRSEVWKKYRFILEKKGVPDWFIWSCEQIKYLFPRAHSYACALNAWRAAWYKLNYPEEFKKVMESLQK